jgi:hypothetical protein
MFLVVVSDKYLYHHHLNTAMKTKKTKYDAEVFCNLCEKSHTFDIRNIDTFKCDKNAIRANGVKKTFHLVFAVFLYFSMSMSFVTVGFLSATREASDTTWFLSYLIGYALTMALLHNCRVYWKMVDRL